MVIRMYRLRSKFFKNPKERVLNILLYIFEKLLTSHLPYPHRTRDAQVMKDMHNRMKPCGPVGSATELSVLAFGLGIADLLNQCWTIIPADRPTITEIQTQLECICEHPVT